MSDNINYNVGGVAFKTAGMAKHYRNYLVAVGASTIILIAMAIVTMMETMSKMPWSISLILFAVFPIVQHYLLTKKTEITASELKFVAYLALSRAGFDVIQSIMTAICMAKGCSESGYLIVELILLQLDTALGIYQTHRLFKLSKLQKLMEEREPELV